MKKYYCNIGLEVHLRLNTKRKLFCDCYNEISDANSNICPYCLGYPGTLPVLNKEVIRKGLLLAHNLKSTPSKILRFDRKNYFYPDLPKGYQITQHYLPLATNGELELDYKSVEIEQIHIEEDAAKLIHHADYSLVDFNRSSAPLVEIVTKPCINTPQDAVMAFKYLRLLSVYLNICDGNMENGDLRCDANISVSGGEELPAYKVEIKNINSFKFMEKALNYELNRQKRILDKGEEIVPETRTLDEASGETYPIRSNETKENYRYIREVDIPIMEVPKVKLFHIELPYEKHIRYAKYGLEKNAAEYLRDNLSESELFDKILKRNNRIKPNALFNILTLSIYNTDGIYHFRETFVDIVRLYVDDKISQKSCIELMKLSNADDNFQPENYASSHKMIYNYNEDYIYNCIEIVIKRNPLIAAEIEAGDMHRFGKIIGQIASLFPDINPKYISEYLKI